MIVYIGADHNGYAFKKELIPLIRDKGYEVIDVGNTAEDPDDDYPTFGRAVAEKVSADYERARGVLICGSGVGMDVVANKTYWVRSALVTNPDQAFDSRHEDDTNVLCIPARYVRLDAAKQIVSTWLETPFSGEARHERRLQEIYRIEGERSGVVKGLEA